MTIPTVTVPVDMNCSKCGARSGDDWEQCGGRCPMPGSPHYSAAPAPEGGAVKGPGDYTMALTEPQAFERFPALASHIERMAVGRSVGSLIEWDGFLRELNAALATREEAPAEAGEDDDDASTYRPSIAGLSDYLWNQALGAESVESRCILEMWREAVDSNAQTGESAKTLDRLCRVEDWAQAPSALRAQPPAREDAQRVWMGVDIAEDAPQEFKDWAVRFNAAHPAPDALRAAVEALKKASRAISAQYAMAQAEYQHHDHLATKHDKIVQEGHRAIREALADLQAEQKGGA